jgi:hypothetical protein
MGRSLFPPMLFRIKRHFVFLLLFVLAGIFFYRPPYLLLHNQDQLSRNVTEGSSDGTYPYELQRHEPEVMDWDSSRVLRGSPTERFRGNSDQHLMIQTV